MWSSAWTATVRSRRAARLLMEAAGAAVGTACCSAVLTALFSQCRPHSAILTVPSSQHCPHSTVLTAPSLQRRPHSAVLTALSSQRHPHSAVLTAHKRKYKSKQQNPRLYPVCYELFTAQTSAQGHVYGARHADLLKLPRDPKCPDVCAPVRTRSDPAQPEAKPSQPPLINVLDAI